MSKRAFTDAQAVDIVGAYQSGENSYGIAARYGVSNVTVLNWLKRSGITPRRPAEFKRAYTLDESVFDSVTPDSAYWIGFIMADGCIKYQYDRWPKISVTLMDIDRDHIVKLRDFMKSNRPLYAYRGTVGFTVQSRRVVHALEGFGVTKRKSLTAVANESVISNRDFWRGMIDGDGCISVDRDGQPLINFCGSRDTVYQWFEFVSRITPLKARPRQTGNVFQITFHCSHARKVIDALYRDCNTRLERKMNIAREFLL